MFIFEIAVSQWRMHLPHFPFGCATGAAFAVQGSTVRNAEPTAVQRISAAIGARKSHMNSE